MNKIELKYELKGKTLEELQQFMEELSEPKFRAKQIYNWMYDNLIVNVDEMRNLPIALREKLDENAFVKSLELITTQNSSSTGTIKYLFSTFDNQKIETVLIPEGTRNTLCISTQVGCPLDCKFCATGLMGYKRNLTPGEIVDQYFLTAKELGKEKITNIVYMGMGEPLLNFAGTLTSLKIFTSEISTGLSRNKITVSTAGIPGKIKELADSGIRSKLALSLHSCFNETRDKIMPINKKYPLEDNIAALKYYARETKQKITFEYTMFAGVNDRAEDIKAISKLCAQLPSKINLIPFNSISHMDPEGIAATLEPTPFPKLLEFAEKLKQKNVMVMVRDTQGDDIAAACGQLAVKY